MTNPAVFTLQRRINAQLAAKERTGSNPPARVFCLGDDEAHLIARFRSGDEDAFAEFFSIYHPKLSLIFWRRIREYTADFHRAEDKATNILFHAYNAPETYCPGENVTHWLLSFHSLPLPNLPRYPNQIKQAPPSTLDNLAADLPGVIPQCALEENTAEAVNLVLDYMNPDYAELLWIKANSNGMTYRQIGTVFGGISAYAVSGRLRRAKRSFGKTFMKLLAAEQQGEEAKPA